VLLLHSTALPKLEVWFRHAFGCEPSAVAFFSPAAGGWNGSSLQGVVFHVLSPSEYDRKKLQQLHHGRPLRVLRATLTLSQKPEVTAFLVEELLPRLADTVAGALYQPSVDGLSYIGNPNRPIGRDPALINALRAPLVRDLGADDWSDL
jgi:hypothetical protein